MSDITKSLLRKLFDYDKEKGVLIRKVRTSVAVGIGDISGSAGIDGYIRVRVNGKLYLSHRIMWLYEHGKLPEHQIDHINHNKSDNRLCNLRAVTHSGNQRNASVRKDNTSGISGVSLCKRENKWVASIGLHGKRKFLGYYLEIFDAICAKKSAEYSNGFHKNHGKTI